jgi:hypothetical protein
MIIIVAIFAIFGGVHLGAHASEKLSVERASACFRLAQEKLRVDRHEIVNVLSSSLFKQEETQAKIFADILEKCYDELPESLVEPFLVVKSPNLNHPGIRLITKIDGHKFKLPRPEHVELSVRQI